MGRWQPGGSDQVLTNEALRIRKGKRDNSKVVGESIKQWSHFVTDEA